MVLLTGLALAAEYLVRVEGTPGQAGPDIGTVLMPFDGWFLALGGGDQLGRPEARVLDRWDDGAHYVFVMPEGDADQSSLASVGRILSRERSGFVIKTDAEGIVELNRLPVELAGIGREPAADPRPPSGPEPRAVPDSLIWQLVGRVSPDSLGAMLVRLRDFRTRYSTTDSCNRAMEWLRDEFIRFNCDSTVLDTYELEFAPNAIGIKHGQVNPRRIFALCGHTDATSQQPYTNTPGSEDNASGTATVLEACRVLADMRFEQTVWFIGFAGEEQGLVGSDSFARHARLRGDSILLAINFDMVSYGREDLDTIVIYGARSNPNSEAYVDFFRAQADSFSQLKHKPTIENIPEPRSDHYSFWRNGFPAIRGGYYDRTPMYHTIGDTIGPMYYAQCGTNNFPMHAELVKALVATIARLAGAHPATAIAEAGSCPPPARVLEIVPSPGPVPLSVRLSRPLAAGEVLEVYDASGRRVRAIAAAGMAASWDGCDDTGSRLGGGSYFFRINGRPSDRTARVVLLD